MLTAKDLIVPLHQHLEDHFEDHLQVTRRFLQQRSISADGDGIPETAEFLADWIAGLGGRVEVIQTPGHPVVLGVVDGDAQHNLMVYGMYDTMPVEGEVWMSDPFAAQIHDLPDLGPSVVARGAVNSKGPLACLLNMLESWRQVHGRLPVNVKFVLEGEEELGSPSLPAVIAAHQDRLRAQGGLYPTLVQNQYGKPILMLGFKGILFLELTVRGGDWGAPVGRAVHSSRAVWYDSPAFVLVQALASLVSQDQQRILIDGFYDDVAPIPEEDQPLLETLAESFDASAPLQADDVRCFKWELDNLGLLKKYLYEPSLNLAGLRSGDTGPGAKTILPHDAFAKIGFRLVPNQDAHEVLAALERHFHQHGFPQVEVHLHDTTRWTRTGVNEIVVQAALRAIRDFQLEPEVWPTQAGSSPMYLFNETLGIPMTPAGLGHGGGAHGPNEYATVEGLLLCEKSLASTLAYFADRVT